jgi:hypothetical protein
LPFLSTQASITPLFSAIVHTVVVLLVLYTCFVH